MYDREHGMGVEKDQAEAGAENAQHGSLWPLHQSRCRSDMTLLVAGTEMQRVPTLPEV